MNQIVIVNGGTKGIGFATAKKFLSCGDKVIVGVVGTRGAFVDLDLAGGQVGIECYLDKIQSELSDTMYMCGARKISDITSKMVRVPKIW